MTAIPDAGGSSSRHPVRWAAFAFSCLVAAGAVYFALSYGGDSVREAPDRPRVKVDPALFEFPTPQPRPRHDPRTKLYAVSSRDAGIRLERWIAQGSYLELTEGRGADRYVIVVLNDEVTFATIEQLNITRMAHGELPYKVVDAR